MTPMKVWLDGPSGKRAANPRGTNAMEARLACCNPLDGEMLTPNMEGRLYPVLSPLCSFRPDPPHGHGRDRATHRRPAPTVSGGPVMASRFRPDLPRPPPRLRRS